MSNDLAAKLLETMRKLKLEEDGVTTEGRDLLAESTRDRYDPTGWYGRRPPTGPLAREWPRNVFIEQVSGGKWQGTADGRRYGPCDTALDVRNLIAEACGFEKQTSL